MITGSCRGETKPQVSREALEYLRQNQDTLLDQSKKLVVKGVQGQNPSKDVWTKWHQNQMLTAEIKKEEPLQKNTRYLAVSKTAEVFGFLHHSKDCRRDRKCKGLPASNSLG